MYVIICIYGCSSSVRVIARSKPSQVAPLHMHVGKLLAAGCRLPAAKRLVCVAPEVDLGECTLHSLLQKSELGRTHSGFETKKRRHLKSKTGVPAAPKKDMCPPKIKKKKKIICMCITVKMDGLT